MKRRIVQHGSSSLTITLPHTWVKKHNLAKGDEVEVEISGPQMILSAEPQFLPEKVSVEYSEFGFFTKNNLTHLYMLGYDEVEIHFNDEKELIEISNRVPECIGFEIIDQKPNRVFIKSIAHTYDDDFDILLRKAFLITKEMGRDMLEAVKSRQFENLKGLRHQEGLNNKFTMTCARMLSKRGYKNSKRTLQMYDIVKQLERIADEYKYICDLLKDRKGALSKEMISLFEAANMYFEKFYALFYKFDPELKKFIYLKRKSFLKWADELMGKTKGDDTRLVHMLSNFVRKTYECAGAYFALIL